MNTYELGQIYLKDLLETLPYDEEIELTARETHYEDPKDKLNRTNGKLVSSQIVVAAPRSLFKTLNLNILLASIVSISKESIWGWSIDGKKKQMLSIVCDYDP